MPVVDDAVAVAVAVAVGFDAGVSGRCGVATRAQSTPRARAVHEAWPRPEGGLTRPPQRARPRSQLNPQWDLGIFGCELTARSDSENYFGKVSAAH